MASMPAPRRPVDDILGESRKSVLKLDELLEELSQTIDFLVTETQAERQREKRQRGRRGKSR